MEFKNIKNIRHNRDLDNATIGLMFDRAENLKKYTRPPVMSYVGHADDDQFSHTFDATTEIGDSYTFFIGKAIYYEGFETVQGIINITNAIKGRVSLIAQVGTQELSLCTTDDLTTGTATADMDAYSQYVETNLGAYCEAGDIITLRLRISVTDESTGAFSINSFLFFWHHRDDYLEELATPENRVPIGTLAQVSHARYISENTNFRRYHDEVIGQANLGEISITSAPTAGYPTEPDNNDYTFVCDMPNDMKTGEVMFLLHFRLDNGCYGDIQDVRIFSGNSSEAAHEMNSGDNDFSLNYTEGMLSDAIITRALLVDVYPSYFLETEIRDAPETTQTFAIDWGTWSAGANSTGTPYLIGVTAILKDPSDQSLTTDIDAKENIFAPSVTYNSKIGWSEFRELKKAQDLLWQYDYDFTIVSSDLDLNESVTAGDSIFSGPVFVPVEKYRKTNQDTIWINVSGFVNGSPDANSQLEVFYQLQAGAGYVSLGTIDVSSGNSWFSENYEITDILAADSYIYIDIESDYTTTYTLRNIAVNLYNIGKLEQIK